MQLGKEIKRLRELGKLTMEELGNAINASKGRISEWESGKNSPGLKTLHKIADYFGVPFEELNKLKEADNDVGNNSDSSQPEIYDKMYKLTDMRELLADKAIGNVTRREVAKLMAKVYEKPLEKVLDELHQSDVLEFDDIRKRK